MDETDEFHYQDSSYLVPNVPHPQGAGEEAREVRDLSDDCDALHCSCHASQSQNLYPVDSKAAARMTGGKQHSS